MKFGETNLLKERNGIRLLASGCRYDRVSYCVMGNGPTKHYDEYDDALEEFNLRWMRVEYD